MRNYKKLSPELTERIRQDRINNTVPRFAANGAQAVRRNRMYDRESIWRPAYARDVDKIMHSP